MRRNGQSSMLEKALTVLQACGGATRPLGVSAIARAAGLPKSTTHRLVHALANVGLLHREGDGYRLGLALFELGELVPVKLRLREAALPFMQDLFEATHETVHLGVRDGLDVVYAEKIRGHTAVPLPSRVGGRLPLTCTAVGKALLAHSPVELIDEVLGRPLRRMTPASVLDPQVLARELDGIRKSGLAYDHEEAAEGGCCIATPILVGGMPVAALSISVSTAAFRPVHLAGAVRTASLSLSRVLARAMPA